MRNLKKVLSALLAMVMLFSAMSIGVEASYSAYKDSAITAWDSIDKPTFSTEQYASMALDEVDRMLAEANLSLNYDLAGLLTIDLDLSTVDAALESVRALWSTVSGMQDTIGGDVVNLDFSSIASSTSPRRASEGSSDLDVILSLFQFFADNADIVAKVPRGTVANGGLDLGIIAGFVDITEYLDLELLAKEAVAGLLYDGFKADKPLTYPYDGFDCKAMTLDEYISTFIDQVVGGTYDPERSSTINQLSEYIQTYIPGINNEIDLLTNSVYDIIESGVRIALNNVIVPLMNGGVLKKLIRELCGVVYTPVFDGQGLETGSYTQDTSNLNQYADFININYTLPEFDMSGWGTIQNDSFVNHLNEILGNIFTALANPANLTVDWDYANGNAGLLSNIIDIGKQLLGSTGDTFFASYVEVLDTTDMTDAELVAYLTRTILNSSIKNVFIENNASTQNLTGVVFECVRQLAASTVPSQDYSALTISTDNIISMLCDMGAYGLNQITNMDLPYGMSVDDFATACVTWVEDNYGGFVSEIQGNTGWEKLSYVIFQLIPANWLPQDGGFDRDNVYTILRNDVLQNILDLDLEGLLSLLSRNDTGELNGTVIELLLTRIVTFFNYILPGTFSDAYTYDTLEALLDPDLLSDLLYNLLTGLNDRAPDLASSLLPLLCQVLGLSEPEEFGYPDIGLPETLDLSSTSSFYMYNGSSGINTVATNATGVTTVDNLYTYEVISVETNQAGVSVTPTSATINGGEAQTFTFVGTPAYETVLSVTITYNVKQEEGGYLTSTPLTVTSYTYVAGIDPISGKAIADDGVENAKADADANGNLHLIYYKKAKYINQNGSLSDIGDVDFTLQRNVSQNASQHTSDASIALSSATIDAGLLAQGVTANAFVTMPTNKKGKSGTYTPYNVSAVDATAPLPDAGTIYQSNFSFTATPTMTKTETISFSQYVCIYNDFGLERLYSSAVNSNRQQANYNMGSYDAEYVDFYELQEELADGEIYQTTIENVSGSTVWNNYVAALEAATAVVCRPRYANSFAATHGDLYESVAYDLYTAVQQLEAGALSSGAAGVETELRSIVPETAIVPGSVSAEFPEGVPVEYYEDGYVYFGREDYVGYTYSNFKDKRKEADNLIVNWKLGNDINAVKAAYVEYRLDLYGERLIRVRAYKEHLQAELANANAIQAGHYSAESWENFLNARNFATTVAAESIGTTYAGSENLNGDGLRQTKVNKALEKLVETRKRLQSSVDYTQLMAAVTAAATTFDSGNASATYTVVTWTPFETAYTAAVQLMEDELEWSEANQNTVNAAATALSNAFAALESASVPGVEVIEDSGAVVLQPGTYDINGEEMKLITGLALDLYTPASADDKITSVGGARIEFDYTDNVNAMQSTGTKVVVYDSADEIVDTFYLVFYGDIDGNAVIDMTDLGQFETDAIDMAGAWIWGADNPWYMAADLDHSAQVDASDLGIIQEVINYTYFPNQQWQTEGDELVIAG